MIVHEGNLNGAGIRLGIVAARFNETGVRTLVNGATDVARRAGVADDAIEPAIAREAREADDLLGRGPVNTRFDQVRVVHAREHRHGHHQRAGTPGSRRAIVWVIFMVRPTDVRMTVAPSSCAILARLKKVKHDPRR